MFTQLEKSIHSKSFYQNFSDRNNDRKFFFNRDIRFFMKVSNICQDFR